MRSSLIIRRRPKDSSPSARYCLHPVSVHQPRNGSLVRTEVRRTYTMLEASRLVVLLRVCCSLAVRFWSCWIVDHGTEQLKLIDWVASTVFYLVCLTMLVTVEYDIVIPMSHDFSGFGRERAPKNLHGYITSSTQAAKSIQRHPRA